MIEPVDVAVAARGETIRQKIAAAVGKVSGCRLVISTGHGREAAELLSQVRAHVAVLDQALPVLSGSDIMRALPAEQRPIPVFLARARDDPEIAFEYHGTGFLPRPISWAALRRAVERAVARVRHDHASPHEAGGSLIGSGFPASAVLQRRVQATSHLTVATLEGPKALSVDKIDWIEAADYCVRLHVAGRVWLLRQSLSALERLLDPGTFIRTHRSAIVNLDRIVASRGRRLLLPDGRRVPVSRARRSQVESRLVGRGCSPGR